MQLHCLHCLYCLFMCLWSSNFEVAITLDQTHCTMATKATDWNPMFWNIFLFTYTIKAWLQCLAFTNYLIWSHKWYQYHTSTRWCIIKGRWGQVGCSNLLVSCAIWQSDVWKCQPMGCCFQFLCQQVCHLHQVPILLGGRRERFAWWKITADIHGSCFCVADRVSWNSANKEQSHGKKEGITFYSEMFPVRRTPNLCAWCCVPLGSA